MQKFSFILLTALVLTSCGITPKKKGTTLICYGHYIPMGKPVYVLAYEYELYDGLWLIISRTADRKKTYGGPSRISFDYNGKEHGASAEYKNIMTNNRYVKRRKEWSIIYQPPRKPGKYKLWAKGLEFGEEKVCNFQVESPEQRAKRIKKNRKAR